MVMFNGYSLDPISTMNTTTLTAAALAATLLFSPKRAHPSSRLIQIKNESGKRAEIYWVDPSTGELVKQTSTFLVNGQTLELNSYVNHTFVVKEFLEEPHECKDDPPNYKSPTRSPLCRRPRAEAITINDHEDQVIHIKQDMRIETEDSESKAHEIVSSITLACQEKVKEQTALGRQTIHADYVLEAFVNCTQNLVADKLEEAYLGK